MKMKKFIIIAGIVLSAFSTKADEGMWLPSFLSKVNVEQMQKLGSTLTATDIYNINSSSIKDAIIVLDHGSCTGELVSPDGLFLTNHHCGYGEIQKHSTEANNILRDGFFAKDREEELVNPGKSVSFLIRVEDVTDSIIPVLTSDMSEKVRKDSVYSISSRLENSATAGNHYEATVKSLYSDNKYYLFVMETFTDVRLVGTPPHFIGKFGGDTDNWMWPRHTGDFSMFRIYTGPDGKPANYSPENIPLKSRHFLPISLKGYENGDFAMVMGYPGSTNRYLTSDGVKFTMDLVNDTRIDVRKEKLQIIGDYMDTGDGPTIQYASKYARSSNYYKFSIGQNRGLKRLKVVDKKRSIEDEFRMWVSKTDEREAKYGEALKLIHDGYSDTDDDKAIQFLNEAFLGGPEIFLLMSKFSELNNALSRNSSPEKMAIIIENLREKLDAFYKDFDAATDQKLVASLTKIYAENLGPNYNPVFLKSIKKKYKGDYQKWAEALFRKTMFASREKVEAFLEKPSLAKIINDPVYKAYNEIYDVVRNARKDNDPETEKLSKGYRLFLAGLMEMYPDRQFYPNANSTMRITYGTVGDYNPADAIHYNYFTTMKGYIEKEIHGDREFDVWPRFKELYNSKDFGDYADKDGTLHTCFITNNDITGGNSGSPVMNGKGELIGIAFDGNWEAMSGDIAFETEYQKCINVDIRYVLWVIDKFGHAKHLIDEMTLIK